MINIILIAILIIIVTLIIFYLYKQKKNGNKCLGCPYAGTCTKQKENYSCNENSK